MKLLLLVIGCCVALAVSEQAEDACAAMRARLLPSLEPSASADAGVLRACDADSDGAVDAAELVSCVQRAFGSTAHMDRAEIGERIHCFRSIMTDTALRGEQRQMIDTEQVRQLGSGSGSVSGLDCGGQNQLAQILVAIVDGQLRAAYEALIDWYIGTLSQSTGLLNGLLNNVSFILQSLLSGRSSESLVYMLTAFVRSADNTLTAPVEDALISSLLAVSVGNFAAARIVIKARLDAGVLNPATQDELQWIIDAFDVGSTEDAVIRIISLLAGCPTSDAQSGDSIYTQVLEVYMQFARNNDSAKELYSTLLEQIQETQPPPFDEIRMDRFARLAQIVEAAPWLDATTAFTAILMSLCRASSSFSRSLGNIIGDLNSEKFNLVLMKDIIELSKKLLDFPELQNYAQAALDAMEDSNVDGTFDEIRNIVGRCLTEAEM